MMRYHTGLGVGHAYAHDQSDSPQDSGLLVEDLNEDEDVVVPFAEGPDEIVAEETVEVIEDLAVGSDGGENFDDEEPLDGEQDENHDVDRCESDDEQFIAMLEMYGR